ncbi:olfactory receptor 10A4-like [Denticeps clupeoides]|uniref:olfactory receptor 10A4-like n=1 Tax=Denticeps clupeoides TaxID=299321 RepID=UPI0010A4E0C8|nr:olfactory receptor 10A4-like [Denticeps clupeoides]
MLQENWTIKEFIPVGFPGLNLIYYGLVSTIFFLAYLATVVANAVLVILFLKEHSLKKPMYGIMFSLALADIGTGTVVLPKIIAKYAFNDETIPFFLIVTVQAYQLPYCEPNRIIQCYCEQISITEQACHVAD